MTFINEVQAGMFGKDFVNGGTNLTALLYEAIEQGYDPGRSRAIAWCRYQPIKQGLFDLCENTYSLDELDSWIIEISQHHEALESLSRAKRKVMEKKRDDAKRIIRSEHNSGWYARYLDHQHWHNIRMLAASKRDNMDRCFCSWDHPQEEWHHPTYAYLGQDRDAEVILPVCMECHGAIHSVSSLSPPRRCPPALVSLLGLDVGTNGS